MNATVVLFAEDPGAANWIAPLVPALTQHGWRVCVLSTGVATQILKNLHVGVREIRNPEDLDRVVAGPIDLVLVGTSSNPDTVGLPILESCRERGIPTIGTVDFPPLYTRAQRVDSAHDRFRGRKNDVLAFAPDWLVLPDVLSSEVFQGLGYPQDRVCIFGNPYFDRVREERDRLERERRDLVRQRLFPGREKRPVLVFATEGAGTSDALEVFLETVGHREIDAVKVLRLHPKDTPGDYRPYLAQIDEVSQEGQAHDLLYAADLTVGLKSMLLAESAILGTPVLSMAAWQSEPNDIPSLSGIHVPHQEDFGDVLDRLVAHPQRVSAEEVARMIPLGSVDKLLDLMQSVF